MLRTSLLKRRAAIVGLVGILAGLALTISGCGKSPTAYQDPNASITTTHTANSLIDAATLKSWIDEGKVNNNAPNVRDRVVILTVATAAQYAAGHIPGSLLLNSGAELTMGRTEAVAALTSETPDGAAMDALIQKLGINRYTTIVFVASTGQNFLNPSRGYFTFRYWGFAKERLKVLQGGENAWTGAGNTLTTTATVARPSTYSVRDHWDGVGAHFNFRMPIGDMIDVVDRVNQGVLSATAANGVTILDTRGGSTPSYVANAKLDDYGQYYVTGASSTFKPTADLTTRLQSFGVTANTSMTYVYCASGHRASSVFFVLDGILGWPVRLYDGSSGQWLAYVTANGVGTAWRVDTNSPNTTLPRTGGTITAGTLVLDPLSNALFTSVTDRRANQVTVEDRAYISSGRTAGGDGGGGDGGGGSPSGC